MALMDHPGIIRLELKYCERCGGLLLRPAGTAVNYCGPCDQKMAELPRRRAAREGRLICSSVATPPVGGMLQSDLDVPELSAEQPGGELSQTAGCVC